MSEQTDTGPAWPNFPKDEFTLRDWFAGMALIGISASLAHDEFSEDMISHWAYNQADSMIEQRNASAS